MKKSSDLDTWSIDRVLYREDFHGKLWLPQLCSTALAGRESCLLDVIQCTLFYMKQGFLRALE